MSISTIDHAPPVVATAITPAEGMVIIVTDPGADHVPWEVLAEAMTAQPNPDPGARRRLARLIYEITNWEVFAPDDRATREAAEETGYAHLAAEYEAEDGERRAIARRRPPAGADED